MDFDFFHHYPCKANYVAIILWENNDIIVHRQNLSIFFMLMFSSAYSVSHLTHCSTPLLGFVVIFMLFNVKGEAIFYAFRRIWDLMALLNVV